jgi:hypothetical protein
MFYLIATALVTGLLGSLHCVGMCGPLALSLPFYHLPKHKIVFAMFLYNLGRATSYSILGFLVGLLGNLATIIGWLQVLSIASGFAIIVLTLAQVSFFAKLQWLKKNQAKISNQLSKIIYQKNTHSFLKIGLLNGLLPCGLIYIALLTSIALGSAFKSMLFMFVFGLGTSPLMLFLIILNYRLSINSRSKLQRIIPVFAVCIGCLLILRGLNLNIPFISPQFLFGEEKIVVGCH